MGKGEPHQHEWVFRMYNRDLAQGQENRPNRMSAYAFNLEGGLGSGSYVQEEIQEKEWIHFVARYDIESNKITLFKNGIQKDQDDLYDKTYGVQAQNGTAPLRLGTRSKWSYFQGCIDDLRIYSRALSESEILALYNEPAPKNNAEIENPEEHSSSSSEVVNQEESQAIRKKTSSVNRSRINSRSKKFFDLTGRLVREE
jgi:hypothetical protein